MTNDIRQEEVAEFINLIKSSWANRGRPATNPASPAGLCKCDYPRCRSMGFVNLRTRLGPRTLCYPHFKLAEQPTKGTLSRVS